MSAQPGGRQPCLPLPPAAAGLPPPSAAPPLPIKAGALMGTLVLTIYVHYALRSPPCLKQFKTRKSLSAFYRVSVLFDIQLAKREPVLLILLLFATGYVCT